MDAAARGTYSGSCVAPDFDKDGTWIFSWEEILFLGIRLQAPLFYKITVVESLTMLPGAFVPNENAGLITTALWTDFDNDGWSDLVEW